MQVAQVVVKTRTTKEDVFDYSIPPEFLPEIKVGILVEVNFHGRKIEGIIVGLKRSSKIKKLLPILSIIDPTPAIDSIHLNLSEWMSDYYFSPLGKTIFENIVPPAKRSIGKYEKISSIHTNQKSKKYLVVADFQTRLNFYLSAVKKNLEKGRSVIILVPDLSEVSFFTKNLKNNFVVLHAGLSKKERWLSWNRIRKGEVKIIIGSQSALFAPVSNLGLIIIDQEENETYKNDRSPRYNAGDVASHLADLSGASLILGTLSPRIETYYQAGQRFLKLFTKFQKIKPAVITDMNFEKSAISNSLENAIKNNLSQKKKILLVLNRKGEGTKFSCPDCGWIALCEKCGLPLIPQNAENVCYHCEKNFTPPAACPKCKNIRLKPAGLGTAKLKRKLTALFPCAKIIQIEKEIDNQTISKDWNIAVATSFALKFLLPRFGLVGLIDADQSLNMPDFNAAQKSFGTNLKFLRLGNEKIIQTHAPENYLINSLASLDYQRFYTEELKNRKTESFPPYAQLIRLEYQNTDQEKAQKESEKIYQELLKLKLDISPPFQPFIQKKKNKFRYQILIRTQPAHLKNTLEENQKDLIKSLPKGWIVDVDPFSLI